MLKLTLLIVCMSSTQRCPQETQSFQRSSLTNLPKPGCKIRGERVSPWSIYVQRSVSRVRPVIIQSFQPPNSVRCIRVLRNNAQIKKSLSSKLIGV